MIIFGTLADKSYIPRLITMLFSLNRVSSDFKVLVLALDNYTEQLLYDLNIANVEIISLEEFENEIPTLQAVKKKRNLIEYIFTLTSALPYYLFLQKVECEFYIYIDADMYFFSDPCRIIKELSPETNVLLTPHNYSSKNSNLLIYGKYNTGFIAFRNSLPALQISRWWFESCINWCMDKPFEGKYADQKYLENFADIGDGVIESHEFGLNLGPWALDNIKSIYKSDFGVDVNNQQLIAMHFSGIFSNRFFFLCGTWTYGRVMRTRIYKYIYKPFLSELIKTQSHLAANMDSDIYDNVLSQHKRRKIDMFVILKAIKARDFRFRMWT